MFSPETGIVEIHKEKTADCTTLRIPGVAHAELYLVEIFPETATVLSIAIPDVSFRRMGFGRALFDTIVDEAIEEGFSYLGGSIANEAPAQYRADRLGTEGHSFFEYNNASKVYGQIDIDYADLFAFFKAERSQMPPERDLTDTLQNGIYVRSPLFV